MSKRCLVILKGLVIGLVASALLAGATGGAAADWYNGAGNVGNPYRPNPWVPVPPGSGLAPGGPRTPPVICSRPLNPLDPAAWRAPWFTIPRLPGFHCIQIGKEEDGKEDRP